MSRSIQAVQRINFGAALGLGVITLSDLVTRLFKIGWSNTLPGVTPILSSESSNGGG